MLNQPSLLSKGTCFLDGGGLEWHRIEVTILIDTQKCQMQFTLAPSVYKVHA
jgi:hypothetical protein